jgi:hypothetical protein
MTIRGAMPILALTLAAAAIAAPALAELQNAQVGGQIHIRALYYRNAFNEPSNPALVSPEIRWPGFFLPQRPIGDFLGGQNVTSYWDWDGKQADFHTVEQRTTLNVSADFTNEVRAFIELESYDVWGEDFRSNYITGVDARANTANFDVEMYQAYIEANEMFGLPVRMRLGRQELVFGNGWLVGNGQSHPEFPGISFDAARLTYSGGSYSVDAFYSTLAEGGANEEDEDISFAGIYASCTALENITFDVYWLWLRDARSLNDTNFVAPIEWLEDLFNLDDYDPTNLHTVGLRAAGTLGAFDFAAEAAYQFGDAGQVGFLFKPFLYGDDDASYDAWAGHVEAGYTFEMAWSPRVYLGAAYVEGEDNRDISFGQWLNPFDRPEASVSFNRLFSDVSYSQFIDEISELSNFWTAFGGVSAHPTESVDVALRVAYLESLETFDQPRHVTLGQFKIPVAPALSFWTQGTDDDIGIETQLSIAYHYSEDLTFSAGWAHLFVGDGLSDGNYNDFNGLLFNGGTDDEDADYLYFDTKICF